MITADSATGIGQSRGRAQLCTGHSLVKAFHLRAGVRAVTTVLVVALLCPPLAAREMNVPGAGDAIGRAVAVAAREAAEQVLSQLPEEVQSIAFVALLDDPGGAAFGAVEHYLVDSARSRGIRVFVARPVAGGSWNDGGDDATLLAGSRAVGSGESGLPNAVIEGQLVYARLDDSGLRAQADLRLRLILRATGQVIASGHGSARVPIEADTFLLGLTRMPGFWPTLLGSAALVLVLVMVNLPLSRQLSLAAKPRQVAG